MLDPQIVADIEALVAVAPARRAACIESLLRVQRAHRWVSDEHLRDVAALLGMSVAELDGVATFYSLLFRRPVGRRVVLVCDSVCCWLRGGDAVGRAVREALGIELGQTTPDERFTLLPTCCLGDCDHAPALLVGDDLHHDVRPADVAHILDSYRGE